MARRGCVCGICESVNLPSVCSSCINYRLIERYKSLKGLAQDRDSLRRRLDEELIAKREAELQRHWRVEHAEQKEYLKERLHQCKEDLIEGKTKREQQQRDLDVQISFLSAASAQVFLLMRAERFLVWCVNLQRDLWIGVTVLTRLGQSQPALQELRGCNKEDGTACSFFPDLIRAQSLVHTAVASELHQKRRLVMRQLCKTLPLRRTLATVEEHEGGLSVQQFVRICNARLPIGEDPLSVPSPELAASLGYMVQLVNLAARYLSAPLLHNAGFAASSSRVWQKASYFDMRPASRSEEYPLFLPRQSGRGSSSEENNELSKSSGSNLGFSSMESPRVDTIESTASLVNCGGISSGARESYPEVQKGIKILRRSVGCITAYGFGLLSLPVPLDMSIFDSFSELLSTLSSRETRTRSSRGNQQPNGRFGLSEGPLARLGSCLASPLDATRFTPEALGQRAPRQGRVTNWNDFYEISTDSELIEGTLANLSESSVDGWDLVEHPRLPPPPSHSEDVEHWTRAMFIDATK